MNVLIKANLAFVSHKNHSYRRTDKTSHKTPSDRKRFKNQCWCTDFKCRTKGSEPFHANNFYFNSIGYQAESGNRIEWIAYMMRCGITKSHVSSFLHRHLFFKSFFETLKWITFNGTVDSELKYIKLTVCRPVGSWWKKNSPANPNHNKLTIAASFFLWTVENIELWR